ncbi:MAG: type II secretion system F family protein, partial [Elusimicrobiales bacterium]|nr:type II secretion system F family protein [Elusimicrobiales bacterium]
MVSGCIAVGTAVKRLMSPKEEVNAMADISDMGTRDSSPFTKLENSTNPIDKLCFFIGRNLKQEQTMETLWTQLGRPSNLDPLKMVQEKLKSSAIVGVVLCMLLGWTGIIGFLVGFIIPDSTWRSKISKRQMEIIRGFPTFVDLAALMIESGLDYMSAFERIVKISTEKSGWESEVEKTINEVQLGYSRRDALRRMSDRIGLQEIRSFVGLIVQSDELGTSLVDLLRNYSADMRFRRLNKAEKLAAQASTKMLIPMFVFIFPTVF